jgi:hypothetical protein
VRRWGTVFSPNKSDIYIPQARGGRCKATLFRSFGDHRWPPFALLGAFQSRPVNCWYPSFHGHCQNGLQEATYYIAKNSDKCTVKRSECKISHGHCVGLLLSSPPSLRRFDVPKCPLANPYRPPSQVRVYFRMAARTISRGRGAKDILFRSLPVDRVGKSVAGGRDLIVDLLWPWPTAIA